MFEIGQKVRVKDTASCLRGYLGRLVRIIYVNPLHANRYEVNLGFCTVAFDESELEPVREANEEQHPQPNQ